MCSNLFLSESPQILICSSWQFGGLPFPASLSRPAKSRVSSCSAFSMSITQKEVWNLLRFCFSIHLSDHLFHGYRYCTSQRGDLNASDSLFPDKPGPRATTSPQPTHCLLASRWQTVHPSGCLEGIPKVCLSLSPSLCAFFSFTNHREGASGSEVELIIFLFLAYSHYRSEKLVFLLQPPLGFPAFYGYLF